MVAFSEEAQQQRARDFAAVRAVRSGNYAALRQYHQPQSRADLTLNNHRGVQAQTSGPQPAARRPSPYASLNETLADQIAKHRGNLQAQANAFAKASVAEKNSFARPDLLSTAGQDLTRVSNLGALPLKNADLRGITATGNTLKGKDLGGANMEGAILSGSNMTGTNFNEAKLNGARLNYAGLKHTSFVGASIGNTSLEGSNITGADFTSAQGRGANFNATHGHDANFSNAQLQNASFRGAQLEAATFGGGSLQGADFSNSVLTNSNVGPVMGEAKVKPRQTSSLPGPFRPQNYTKWANVPGMIIAPGFV